MIHGGGAESLIELKEAAKQVVIQAMVRGAEADGVPATLRAMYVLKTAEARMILAGGRSSFITGEAELRGMEVQALAQLIVDLASASEKVELQRIALNVQIDAAEKPSDVVRVLASAGLKLPHVQV